MREDSDGKSYAIGGYEYLTFDAIATKLKYQSFIANIFFVKIILFHL